MSHSDGYGDCLKCRAGAHKMCDGTRCSCADRGHGPAIEPAAGQPSHRP